MFFKTLVGLLLMVVLVKGDGLLRNPCNSASPVCTGCKTLTFCRLVNGIYVPGSKIDCPISCWDGECSNLTCPTIVSYDVDTPGVYPDPFSCDGFLVAADSANGTVGKPITVTKVTKCPDTSTYFEATTMQCTQNTTNFCRPASAVSCSSTSIKLPIRDFAKFYYTCDKSGKTTIKRCPQGTIFMGKPLNDCWSETSSFLFNGKCFGAGKYYHQDCTYYSNCAAVDATPSSVYCGSGMRFNYFYEKCVPRKCYH